MRLVPVFILVTYNKTNYKCLPKFVQTDNGTLVSKRPFGGSVGTGKEKITVIIGRLSVRLWAHAYKKLRKNVDV